jgi:ABC-2 type transport system permease protein
MMMKFNITLLGFIRKEFRQTLRDPRMISVLLFAPIIQLTLFGVALSNEVKNVKLAAQFAPSDVLAGQVFDHALASSWFVKAHVTGPDPNDWMESGEADVTLITPPGGLTRSVGRGEGQLQVLINAGNVIRAQAIENYVRSIVRQTTQPKSGPMPTPVSFDVRVLYNPTLDTKVYMVPGVMCMLICIITVLLTSMSLAREREVGTYEMLIVAPVKPWEVIIGKTLPFVILGMCEIPLILLAAVMLFGIPVRGPVLLLMFSGIFFVLSTVSIGTLISTLAKNQQQAMLGGFLFLFPAMLLSGLMFPLENMPWLLRWFGHLNPLSHFMVILRNILLKGGDLDLVAFRTAILAVISFFLIFASFNRFRTRLG